MFDKGKMCRLRDIYRAIAEVENEMLSTFGMNLNEAMLMCQLNDKAGLTAGEIADALGLTQSNASKVIRSLENKKLLVRSLDKTDKRVMHYQLTKAGREKMQTMNCDELTFPPILNDVLNL